MAKQQTEPPVIDPEETTGPDTVSIDRDTAVAVLTALNFKAPDTWDDQKILDKLTILGNVKGAMDHVKKIKDDDVRGAAEAIIENVGNTFEFDSGEVEAEASEGEEVEPEVEEETAEESEAEGEAEEETAEEEVEPEPEPTPTPAKKETKVATQTKTTPAKPAAKAPANKPAAAAATKTNPKAPPAKPAAKAPAEKPAKEKKEAVEKDAFGMRLGTRAARLNEAITGDPRTPKEIQEAAQYDKSIHNHLKKLVELGFVVVKDGKYSRKGAAPKAKPAAKAPATAAKKVAAKK